MAIGDRIKEARKAKGMTQRQLADEIHAKHNSVSNWENNQNKPDPDTIELICGVLNVSPSWLMGYAEERTKRLIAYAAKITGDKKLMEYYNNLNEAGKEEAIKRVKELTFLPDYRIQAELTDIAAHAKENQTEDGLKHDIDIITGDDF